MTETASPIHADNPIPGRYKYRRNRDAPWEPCAIFWHKPSPLHREKLMCIVGPKARRREEDPFKIWTFVADNKVSKQDFDMAYETGKWPADPPPVPVVAPAPIEEKPATVTPTERRVGPGDNSGDTEDFEAMVQEGLAIVQRVGETLAGSPIFRQAKATLEADVAEAAAFYAEPKNKIVSKVDADKAENWRTRIRKAAAALDDARKAEKAHFQSIADAVDARYFPVIRLGTACAGEMQRLADRWAVAETERRQRAAAEEAQRQLEAARAEAKALAPEGWPVEEPAAVPVVVPEKILMGTGHTRRSAKTGPATAVIVDLAAAAAYYAAQQNPELLALIQKLANKAAKAKAQVPGCVMSWEAKPAQQAAAQKWIRVTDDEKNVRFVELK